MPSKIVTPIEFRQNAGQYTDASGKEKAHDTRRALYPHELDEETKARLEEGYQGEETPHLDHLLD